jgi:hypothetical protein
MLCYALLCYVLTSDYDAAPCAVTVPGAVVTTLAGSATSGAVEGTGTAASFSGGPLQFYIDNGGVRGIALDSTGNIYVADTGNYKIRKITSAGVVTTFSGTGMQGYLNGPPRRFTQDLPKRAPRAHETRRRRISSKDLADLVHTKRVRGGHKTTCERIEARAKEPPEIFAQSRDARERRGSL